MRQVRGGPDPERGDDETAGPILVGEFAAEHRDGLGRLAHLEAQPLEPQRASMAHGVDEFGKSARTGLSAAKQQRREPVGVVSEDRARGRVEMNDAQGISRGGENRRAGGLQRRKNRIGRDAAGGETSLVKVHLRTAHLAFAAPTDGLRSNAPEPPRPALARPVNTNLIVRFKTVHDGRTNFGAFFETFPGIARVPTATHK